MSNSHNLQTQYKICSSDIGDIYYLTPMQESMLYHYILYPSSKAYFEQTCYRINSDSDIDISAFQSTWEYIGETNEVIRTIFRWEKLHNPLQIVTKRKILINFFDLSNFEIKKQYYYFYNITSQERTNFDISEKTFKVGLCKFHKNDYIMIISHHHIVCDGWSNSILLEEFLRYYHLILENKGIQINKKNKYKHYVNWILKIDEANESKYWSDYLYGYKKYTINNKYNLNNKTCIKKRLEYKLQSNTFHEIKTFVGFHNITIATLVYFVWGSLLYEITGHNDVVFGISVTTRPSYMENEVGLFINTLPLRMIYEDNKSIIEQLYQLSKSLIIMKDHQKTPLKSIYEYADYSIGTIFDTVVVIQNYPVKIPSFEEDNNIKITLHSRTYEINMDLSLGVRVFRDLVFDITYDSRKYSYTNIDTFIRSLINKIKKITLGEVNDLVEILIN